MPHNVRAWTDAQPGKVVLYIDESLITEEEARKIEASHSPV
ncbi:hypothetical protein [Streptomyces sp. NPDC048669]